MTKVAKDDKSRSPTERAMYSGLISLQNRNMTVAYADKLIRRCIIFIDNLKEKPGTKCLEARVAIKEDINPQQLLTSATNNLKWRLFTTISSNKTKSTSGSVHTNSKQEECETPLKELKVLECDHYGEIEIERLCQRFKLTPSKIKNRYHNYLKDSSRVSKELNLLLNHIKLIPCSSVEYERGFRQMDLIISPTRNRITTPHVSSLM
ncbi:hypothetical protein PR048_004111 [Dryococelus australis]|uniref:HAT C-terminal dimerisation domain-containing protein n=1 Tax=Dryococelus australis TaxID=614101 RepID=A0ABQ9I4J8_9NEOP|nr:hypothetical protein PR048_004111 [Dryococelus australis]